tara:strand:- start:464 stop:976 length:513 start_codon:yes stop_codon:yes gene_type:complete
MISKKIYYLWGLFPPQEIEYLNFIKDKVQTKLISPCFDLHITLAGPFLDIDKTFISKLKSFGEVNSSIVLHADGYRFKQEIFKSFYISIKDSLHLHELRKNIYKLNKFDLDNNYSPHISLCYGNYQIEEKKELISKLPDFSKLVTVSKIALVEINKDINKWKIQRSFDLN